MNSELEALDHGGKSDFLWFLWDHDTSPAASLQTLGIHSLERLLYLQSEAVNPAVFVVEPLEPTEVGTHFCRVGCSGLVFMLKALTDGRLTLELPTRLRVGATGVLRMGCGLTGADRCHQRAAKAGLVITARNRLVRGFTGKFVGSIEVVRYLLEGVGRWVEFGSVRTARQPYFVWFLKRGEPRGQSDSAAYSLQWPGSSMQRTPF